MPTVRKDEAAGRYEVLTDEGVVAGFTEFQVHGNQVVMPHTLMEPAFSGQGLASLLVKEALADIRAAGRCVVPKCPFVRSYIDRKPDWQPLVCAL